MANTKASQKSILTGKRNHDRNQAKSSKIKTLIKKLGTLKEEKELTAHLSLIFKELDGADVQVVHPNKANRLKSAASKLVKKILNQDSGKK
jgi:ribosomal protein S20